MRILLILQNESLATRLTITLEQRRFVVEWTNNGTIAVGILQIEEFDVVILDREVPGRNGFDLLSQLHAQDGHVPVLALARTDLLSERIESLNEGADDVLSSSFSVDELEARLHALVRRHHRVGFTTITCGPLVLDIPRRVCRLGGRELNLSQREYALLLALMQRAGRTVSRQSLFDRVFGHHDAHMEALHVIACRLRKHLTGASIRIVNVRGVGYRLECPDIESPPD